MKIQHFFFFAGMLVIGYLFGSKFDTNFLTSQASAEPVSYDQAAIPRPASNATNIAPSTEFLDAESAIISLFEQSAPSVCFITTKVLQTNYYNRNLEEIPQGQGSGFIWDKEGHIITNAHVVVNGKAYVTLADRSTWEAEVVGIEKSKDLAVLKIKAPSNALKPIAIGLSRDLKVGQTVLAIGNPFGLDQTLTTGVISALGREIKSLTGTPIRDVIQTDAAINPGNSGGPLLDSGGRLIGVNTQIYSPSGASSGIGFSIPVDEVNWVVPELIKYGVVKRPTIGVALLSEYQAAQVGLKGAVIGQVVSNGPADRAGLRGFRRSSNGDFELGDVITGLGDDVVNSFDDLILALEKFKVSDKVKITYQRDNKKYTTTVVLGELR
jgi:S1-C subfamily serine protease